MSVDCMRRNTRCVNTIYIIWQVFNILRKERNNQCCFQLPFAFVIPFIVEMNPSMDYAYICANNYTHF
jgi:hypothetical protein